MYLYHLNKVLVQCLTRQLAFSQSGTNDGVFKTFRLSRAYVYYNNFTLKNFWNGRFYFILSNINSSGVLINQLLKYESR